MDDRLADVRSWLPAAPVTAVLWDIDGTLLTSGGAVAGTFLDAVQAVCGTRPDPADLDFGGRLDPEIAATLVAAVDGAPAQVDDVLAQFELLVHQRRDVLRGHVRVLPGVADLVAELAAAGIVQTVVSGNLASVGRLKLEAAGLIPPIELSLAGFGDSAVDRAAVARLVLGRLAAAGWSGTPDTCWVIGDTPRDLACARALGLRCALVATGRHGRQSLAALDADIVLDGLAEAAELRAVWFAATPRAGSRGRP